MSKKNAHNTKFCLNKTFESQTNDGIDHELQERLESKFKAQFNTLAIPNTYILLEKKNEEDLNHV